MATVDVICSWHLPRPIVIRTVEWDDDSPPRATHTICPECKARMMDAIDRRTDSIPACQRGIL